MIPFFRSEGYSNKKAFVHALVTACVAGLFFTAFVLLSGIAPFGDNTWSVFDMQRQYLDFYSWYKDLLAGKNNILYEPAMALGSGAVGFFAYYLSSPLLLLLAFFDVKDLNIAVTFLAGLRFMLTAAVCDACLMACMRRRTSKEDRMPQTMLFALAYTFCSYMIAYCINPMWMEVWLLMPLTLWMLERLLFEKKCIAYVLSLALMLWCNYYIAYMVCAFIVLWTLYLLWMDREAWFAKLLRVGLCSLWAVLLDAVLMIPTFLELFGSPKDASAAGELHEGKNLLPWQALRTAWAGVFDGEQTYWGTPLLYAGMLILLLTILFFLNREITRKEKLGLGGILVFLFLSLSVDKLNLLWHAGMEPSGYPYRQAFLFVFVCVFCSCRAFRKGLKGNRRRDVLIAASLALCLFFASVLGNRSAFSVKTIVLNIALILGAAVLLFVHMGGEAAGKPRLKKVLPAALLLFQMGELLLTALLIYRVQTASGMQTDEQYRSILAGIEESLVRIEDDGFYRMENMHPRKENDGMMFEYNSLTHYSSAGLVSTRRFLQKLGYHDDGLYTEYGGNNTCTADSLLGIRYLLAPRNRGAYELLREGSYPLYKNPFALSPLMLTDHKTVCDDTDPFTMQESIYREWTGEECRFFIPAKWEMTMSGAGDVEYECELQADGCVYLYLDGIEDRIQNIAIELNGVFLSGYGNLSCLNVLNLGEYHKGERLKLRVFCDNESPDPGKMLLVTEDIQALEEAYEKAAPRCAGIKEISERQYEILLPEAEGSGLSTTIPYERSWRVYCGGKRIQTEECMGAMLYIPLDDVQAGERIIMKYVPEGMEAGAVLSIAAMAALLFYGIGSLLRIKKAPLRKEDA